MYLSEPAIVIWVVLLLFAVPIVKYIKHPAQKPFAAYLIFVAVFSIGVYILFKFISATLQLFFKGSTSTVASTIIIFALCVLPSAALAAWIAGKPPLRPPRL